MLYSVNVAGEWLRRGRRVAVLCGRRDRRLGPLEPFLANGQLSLHPIADEEHLRFSHHAHIEVADAADELIRVLQPTGVHVHNFQGMLSAVQVAAASSIPVVLTAVDYGLLCFNFCLCDGTVEPCTGPQSPGKCADCVRATIQGPARWLARALPRALTRELWPRFVRLDQIQGAGELHALMWEVLQSVDAIVAPSPHLGEKLCEYGAARQRVHHCIYGLPSEMIVRPPKEPSPILRLAYLGGAEPIKGFQVLADAAAMLPDGLPLVIRALGGQSMAERVAGCSDAARRYLRHEPSVFGAALAAEHARIDGVLVPSIVHDNSPFVVLEALANGTAVLAADRAGIRHLIEHNRTGWLIPAGHPRAWTDAIAKAVRQPETIREMQRRTAFTRTVSDFVDDLERIEGKLLTACKDARKKTECLFRGPSQLVDGFAMKSG